MTTNSLTGEPLGPISKQETKFPKDLLQATTFLTAWLYHANFSIINLVYHAVTNVIIEKFAVTTTTHFRHQTSETVQLWSLTLV